MKSAGIGTSGEISQSLPMANEAPAQLTGRASFGSGVRDVKTTEIAVRFSVSSGQITIELASPAPKQTALSDRSVTNASTQEKGSLRKLYDEVKAGASKAFNATTTAAKTAGQKVRAGVKEFKSAPKETASKTLKSLKERSVSVKDNIKAKLPSRPEGMKLSAIKSLFSRSAKSVPPSPSASVLASVKGISTAKREGAEQLQKAKYNLTVAESDLDNVKTLNKLLKDPTSVLNSSDDVTVKWGGEEVKISGEGDDRAVSFTKAFTLATANRSEIRAQLPQAKDEIKDLKAEQKAEKKKLKEDIEGTRKQALNRESKQYEVDRELLKTKREQLKTGLKNTKQNLKNTLAENGTAIKEQRAELEASIEADKQEIEELKAKLEESDIKLEKTLGEFQKRQAALNETVTEYAKKASNAPEHERGAALDSVRTAGSEAKKLEQEIQDAVRDANAEQAIQKAEIAGLEAGIDVQTQELEILESGTLSVLDLKKTIKDFEDQLEQNSKALDALKGQHQVDQKAIKKA